MILKENYLKPEQCTSETESRNCAYQYYELYTCISVPYMYMLMNYDH